MDGSERAKNLHSGATFRGPEIPTAALLEVGAGSAEEFIISETLLPPPFLVAKPNPTPFTELSQVTMNNCVECESRASLLSTSEKQG